MNLWSCRWLRTWCAILERVRKSSFLLRIWAILPTVSTHQAHPCPNRPSLWVPVKILPLWKESRLPFLNWIMCATELGLKPKFEIKYSRYLPWFHSMRSSCAHCDSLFGNDFSPLSTLPHCIRPHSWSVSSLHKRSNWRGDRYLALKSTTTIMIFPDAETMMAIVPPVEPPTYLEAIRGTGPTPAEPRDD